MRLLSRLGLQLRTALLAALGLSLALAAFASVGLRAVEERSARIQHERLAIAQIIAGGLDRDLDGTLRVMRQAASRLEGDLSDPGLVHDALRDIYLLSQWSTYRVLLLDRTGRVLMTEPQDSELTGLDLSDQAFVRQGLHNGQAAVSNTLPATLLGRSVVAFSVPVRDGQGAVAGLFVSTVDLREHDFSASFRHAHTGETCYAELIDGDGTVIASAHPERILQPWEHWPAAPWLLTTPQPHTGVSLEVVKPDGADVLAFVPLSGARWGVAVEQDATEALAPIQRLRQEFLLLGLTTLLVALFLVVLTTRRVIKPALELTALAKRIANGELETPVVIQGQDEIGQLVRAFEEMRASLAASQAAMVQRARQLSLLHRTALAGAEARDIDELAARITRLLADELYPENVGFLFLDDARKCLQLHPSYHGVEPAVRALTIPLGHGVAGTVAQTGEPLLVTDVPAAPNCVEGSPEAVSELCVPVRADGQVVGVLNVASSERDAFSQDDLHLVSAVAGHAGTALEKLKLIRKARRRASELEALQEVALDITGRLELPALLEGIVRRAAELLGADSGTLELYDPEQGYLECVVSYNLGADYTGTRLAVGEGMAGRIIATGEPLIVDNYQTWEGRAPVYAGVPAMGIVGVPLGWQEQSLGVIEVINLGERRPFDESDVVLLEAFARQAAVVIVNARLFEATERRAEELEAIRQVSLSLASSLELQTVLDAILEGTFKLLSGVQNAHIFLYRDGRVIFGAARRADGRQDRPIADPGPGGLTFTVARQGQAVIVPDMSTHPLFIDAPHEWMGAIIALPLKIGERVVGVMDVAYAQPREFSEAELHTLRLLADQAAIAIENAELFEAAEQRAAVLEVVHQVSLNLTASLDLRTVLDTILEGTFRLLPEAEDAHIFLYQSADDSLTFGAAQWANGIGSQPVTSPRPGGFTHTIARTGEPLIVPNVRTHPMFAGAYPGWEGAIVGLPLKMGQQVVGVMNVAYARPHDFPEAELRALRLLGDQAAVAIERAQLFEAEQSARKHAETLQGVATALGSTLELEELLHLVLQELQKVVPYTSASIQLLRDGRLEIIGGRGFADPTQVVGLVFPLTGDNPNKKVIAEKRPVLIPDAYAAYADFKQDPHSHIRSWLGVPLLSKGEPIGMITLDRAEINAFSEEDAAIALAFANHVAVALENARLYETTRRQAITDGLTGLYNARFFYQTLESELRRSRRYGHPCSLLMLDLDDFKKYNDCYGHLAGDDLLQELASLIRDEIRLTDVAVRYGGEEFAVILPETDLIQAQILAERLRVAIRDHEFIVRETRRVGRITVSQGLATYPDDAQDVEGLVEAADMALLQAKIEKDRICKAAEVAQADLTFRDMSPRQPAGS